MSHAVITSIREYPIKSCAGIILDHATINVKGLENDRRWMLIDDKGKFISQRQYAILSQVVLSQADQGYIVSFPNMKDIFLPKNPIRSDQILSATIQGDDCMVLSMGKEYEEWFSAILGKPCTLVYIPDDSMRTVEGENVGLADSHHSLIISQSSVAHLSELLGDQVSISVDNFRPNIVVTLEFNQPNGEDNWMGKDITMGEVCYRGVKPCSRCKIITINPLTSIADPNILKQLMSYRSHKALGITDAGIYFGLYCSTDDIGKIIKVGDKISSS